MFMNSIVDLVSSSPELSPAELQGECFVDLAGEELGRVQRQRVALEIELSDSEPEELPSVSWQAPKKTQEKEIHVVNMPANLQEQDIPVAKKTQEKEERKRQREEVAVSSPNVTQEEVPLTKKLHIEKEERKRQREELKATQKLERQNSQRIKSANRKVISAAQVAQELTVCCASSLLLPQHDAEFGQTLRHLLEPLNVAIEPTATESTVTWKRTVDRRYDDENDLFIPLDTPVVTHEPYVLVWQHASQFCRVGVDTPRIQNSKGKRLIWMIEGRDRLYLDYNAFKTRQLKARLNYGTITTDAGWDNILPKQEVEERLVRLQMNHDALVIMTKNAQESARWIAQLTKDLASLPYKHLQSDGSMAGGTLRSTRRDNVSIQYEGDGATPESVWFRMLQQVRQCTPCAAAGISQVYPTLFRMRQAWQACTTDKQAQTLLASVSAIADPVTGVQRQRKVGPTLSKRIYHIFNTDDPTLNI